MTPSYDAAAQRVKEALNLDALPERGTPEYMEFLADLEDNHPGYAQLLSDAELNDSSDADLPDLGEDEPAPERHNLAVRMRLITDALKRRALWRQSPTTGRLVLDKSRGPLAMGALMFLALGTYSIYYYTQPKKGGGALISQSSTGKGTAAEDATPVVEKGPKSPEFGISPESLAADATVAGVSKPGTKNSPAEAGEIPPPPGEAQAQRQNPYRPSTRPMVDTTPPPAFQQRSYAPPAENTLRYNAPASHSPSFGSVPSVQPSAPVPVPVVKEPAARPFPYGTSGAQPRTVGVTTPPRPNPVRKNQNNSFASVGAGDASSSMFGSEPTETFGGRTEATGATAAASAAPGSPTIYTRAAEQGAAEAAQPASTSPVIYMASTTAATQASGGQPQVSQNQGSPVQFMAAGHGEARNQNNAVLYTRKISNPSPVGNASMTASAAEENPPVPTSTSGASASPFGEGAASAQPAAPLAVGQIVTAKLVTAVETYAGRPVPVVAESSEGNWVGIATVNPTYGRMEVQFTRLVKDGQTYEVNGLGYDTGYTLGLSAATRDVAPALGQDLVRAGLSSLNSYAQGLANAGSTILTGGGAVSTRNAAPLSAIVAGELGKVFELPKGQESFIRVARVERGTEFLIAIGLTEKRR